MKQTSQAEQPNVPPPARLPPKSTTPPAAAKPLTLKDVRGKRPAKDAEQRPTKNPAWANSSLARDDQVGPTRHAHQEAMAERSIALPHRCGCTGVNRRTCLIWPATQLSVSAVPPRCWGLLRQPPARRQVSLSDTKAGTLRPRSRIKLRRAPTAFPLGPTPPW